MKQAELDFTHYHENSRENLISYQQQKKRLSKNTEILVLCMKEGQRLTGLDIMRGIKHKGMSEPVIMTEYRRRFKEAIDAGIDIKTERHSNGSKTWYIDR